VEFQKHNYQMLEFYYRLKAGMPMPDDAVVQWYSGLLCMTFDSIDRSQANLAPFLLALGGVGGKQPTKR